MKENRRVANESWMKGLRQNAAVILLLQKMAKREEERRQRENLREKTKEFWLISLASWCKIWYKINTHLGKGH